LSDIPTGRSSIIVPFRGAGPTDVWRGWRANACRKSTANNSTSRHDGGRRSTRHVLRPPRRLPTATHPFVVLGSSPSIPRSIPSRPTMSEKDFAPVTRGGEAAAAPNGLFVHPDISGEIVCRSWWSSPRQSRQVHVPSARHRHTPHLFEANCSSSPSGSISRWRRLPAARPLSSRSGGHTPWCFQAFPCHSALKDGKLRALAVTAATAPGAARRAHPRRARHHGSGGRNHGKSSWVPAAPESDRRSHCSRNRAHRSLCPSEDKLLRSGSSRAACRRPRSPPISTPIRQVEERDRGTRDPRHRRLRRTVNPYSVMRGQKPSKMRVNALMNPRIHFPSST